MVIYEVNLTINQDIYDQYLTWLKLHVADMLKFKGFRKAQINEQIEDSAFTKERFLTVRYSIDSWPYLEEYLDYHSSSMRKLALEKFKDKFKANRRIFNILDTISIDKQLDVTIV